MLSLIISGYHDFQYRVCDQMTSYRLAHEISQNDKWQAVLKKMRTQYPWYQQRITSVSENHCLVWKTLCGVMNKTFFNWNEVYTNPSHFLSYANQSWDILRIHHDISQHFMACLPHYVCKNPLCGHFSPTFNVMWVLQLHLGKFLEGSAFFVWKQCRDLKCFSNCVNQ